MSAFEGRSKEARWECDVRSFKDMIGASLCGSVDTDAVSSSSDLEAASWSYRSPTGEAGRAVFKAVSVPAVLPSPDFDGPGDALCIEPLLFEKLECELPGLSLPSCIGGLARTLCLNLLYRPLIPLLTSSFVPALLAPAPPSKSWKEVKVSDLEADVWMWSSAWERASLSISLREVIEASDPRRDLAPPISGRSTEEADGEGGSGAMIPGV